MTETTGNTKKPPRPTPNRTKAKPGAKATKAPADKKASSGQNLVSATPKQLAVWPD